MNVIVTTAKTECLFFPCLNDTLLFSVIFEGRSLPFTNINKKGKTKSIIKDKYHNKENLPISSIRITSKKSRTPITKMTSAMLGINTNTVCPISRHLLNVNEIAEKVINREKYEKQLYTVNIMGL